MSGLVCDGEVSDTEVSPIYGNGDDAESSSKPKLEGCGVLPPPRPNAKRVEEHLNRRVPFILGPEY